MSSNFQLLVFNNYWILLQMLLLKHQDIFLLLLEEFQKDLLPHHVLINLYSFDNRDLNYGLFLWFPFLLKELLNIKQSKVQSLLLQSNTYRSLFPNFHYLFIKDINWRRILTHVLMIRIQEHWKHCLFLHLEEPQTSF